MDPLTILALARAGIGAGQAIGGYFAGRKDRKRKFGETARGRNLQKTVKEGAISPELMNQLLGRQNRALSGVSESEMSARRGEAVSAGLEGSIASRRFIREPALARQRQLGETSRGLAAENAQSKIDAERAFASEKTDYNEQQRAAKRDALVGLIGGVGGAAAGLLGDLATNKQNKDLLAKQDALQAEDRRRYDEGRSDTLTQRREDKAGELDNLKIMLQYKRLVDAGDLEGAQKFLESLLGG